MSADSTRETVPARDSARTVAASVSPTAADGLTIATDSGVTASSAEVPNSSFTRAARPKP